MLTGTVRILRGRLVYVNGSMAEIRAGERSFSLQVLRRAWFGAWEFFESWQRDAVLFVASLLVGGGYYVHDHGWPTNLWAGMDAIIHAAAPAVIIWLLLFLWHLWLAPAALVYEAAKEVASREARLSTATTTVAKPEKPVDWAPWRSRAEFSLYEFAKILSKTDPAAQAMSTAGSGYIRLLLEEIRGEKLQYISRLAKPYNIEIPPDYETHIRRADAISWAKDKNYDISHIE